MFSLVPHSEERHIVGITQYIDFSDWFLSHVFKCPPRSFYGLITRFFVMLNNIPSCGYNSAYPWPTERHIVCLQCLVIMGKAVTHIPVQLFMSTCFCHVITGSYVQNAFCFRRSYSIVGLSDCITSHSHQLLVRAVALHTSTAFGIANVVDFSHSHKGVVMPHCFNLVSLITCYGAFLHLLVCHFQVVLVKNSVQIFCNYWLGGWSMWCWILRILYVFCLIIF